MKKLLPSLLLLLTAAFAEAEPATLYWFNAKTAPLFEDVATRVQPGDKPEFVCLAWMRPCTPGDSSHAVIRNNYQQGVKTKSLPGIPDNELAEVYHNGWYQEPGFYFYIAKGAGVFLNVGHTLVARNKIDALKKLGLSDKTILRSLPISVFTIVTQRAETNGKGFKENLLQLINQARKGQPYQIDRLSDGMFLDYLLYETAKEKGYDTVQLTNQPNKNGGWAFELVDVRPNLADTLKKRWQKHRALLQAADSSRCQYSLPFDMLSCH